KFEQRGKRRTRRSAFHDGGDFHDLTHNLSMLMIALDIYRCGHRFRKGLCDLDFGHACRIRVSLYHLQKAWPDMLGAGGVDCESAMSMPSRCRTNEFPCFRATRFANHHSMRTRTQS